MTTNEISGTYASGITLTSDAFDNPVTVTAAADISGGTQGAIAAGTAWTIDNSGQVSGTSVGVYFYAGGSVTNTGAGDIDGGNYGVFAARAAGTIDNASTISSTGGVGVFLGAGGAITNETHGVISGHRGIVFDGATAEATLINAGAITATAGTAISMYLGTVINSGDISATDGTGILLQTGGTITNTASATIDATTGTGIYGGAQSTTIENAGTIGGAFQAVYFTGTAANRLIVDAGAVFDGAVVANSSGTNTIELTSGAVAGTLSGLGSEYQGFQTVTVDSGASWTVAGTVDGFGSATIQGLTDADRLDLTDVTFSSGDTVNLDSGTDILTVKDAGGAVLDTVHLAGSFANEFFHLADDGNHGTYVTEDEAPCYCRGTLILTDKGEVAVEALSIGDRLVTKSGEARPIRWIGMRSFNGQFVANNRNILPVLIKADALADNVPKRDLWVSPLHTMYLDNVLIPAFALVNGTSICQAESVDRVEYFHMELESHDVIVAEGALSESFTDDDSRNTFGNAAEYRRLYPDTIRKPAEYCAPIVEDGELLENVRRRIAARVEDERMSWAA